MVVARQIVRNEPGKSLADCATLLVFCLTLEFTA